MRNRLLTPAIASLALLTLAACGTDGIKPQPTLSDLSLASAVAIRLTRACKALTVPAASPKDLAGKDVFQSRREWIKTAEVRAYQLRKTGECIDRTADEYAR